MKENRSMLKITILSLGLFLVGITSSFAEQAVIVRLVDKVEINPSADFVPILSFVTPNLSSKINVMVTTFMDADVADGAGVVARLQVNGVFVEDPKSGTTPSSRLVPRDSHGIRATVSTSYIVELAQGVNNIELAVDNIHDVGTAFIHKGHTGFTVLVVQ